MNAVVPAGRMRTVARYASQIAGLTLVWVLLWGTVSVKIVLGGLIVGTAVTALFPMPAIPGLPLRPWRLLQLVGYLAGDLFVSGWYVAWETLRYGPRAKAGIIAVPLRTSSDRLITVIAGGAALTPGSFVLQIDRPGERWYVYALGLRRPEDVERVRRRMQLLQHRVIAAMGTPDDVLPDPGSAGQPDDADAGDARHPAGTGHAGREPDRREPDRRGESPP